MQIALVCPIVKAMQDISLPIPPPESSLDHHTERPFVVVHEQLDRKLNGAFRPSASLKLMPDLRTSGFLRALPATEFKTLICLLTFLSPNGEILPSLPDIAQGLNVSEREAQDRMERLLAFTWQGRPIVMYVARETALPAYTLCPDVLTRHEHAVYNAPAEPPLKVADRDAIIALSREKYSRPRATVEEQIEQQFRREEPPPVIDEDDRHADLRRRLMAVGVASEQVNSLFQHYSPEAIAQQLEWLPHRHANNPARYLIAAIQGDYQAPLSLRHRHAVSEEEGEEANQPADSMPPS
jgi:hypothetical protein